MNYLSVRELPIDQNWFYMTAICGGEGEPVGPPPDAAGGTPHPATDGGRRSHRHLGTFQARRQGEVIEISSRCTYPDTIYAHSGRRCYGEMLNEYRRYVFNVGTFLKMTKLILYGTCMVQNISCFFKIQFSYR